MKKSKPILDMQSILMTFFFTAVTNQVYQELSSIKTRSVLTRACPPERKTRFH